MTAGKFLRNMRKKRNLTQKSAAEKLGVAASYICKIETGGCIVPSGSYQKLVEIYSMNQVEQREFHVLMGNSPRILPKIKTVVNTPNAAAVLSALLALAPSEFEWVVR